MLDFLCTLAQSRDYIKAYVHSDIISIIDLGLMGVTFPIVHENLLQWMLIFFIFIEFLANYRR